MGHYCSIEHVRALCRNALQNVGASEIVAEVLARATCQAEVRGKRAVGISHLFDYLDSIRDGRLDPTAKPEISRVTDAIVVADARSGAAQVAFEMAYDEYAGAVRHSGIGMLNVVSSFTAGELGFYTRRLAGDGFLVIAGANSPALMTFGGSTGPTIGTNPLAFACPVDGRSVLAIDQASSQTAYVNVRSAAAQNASLPSGWAVDEFGIETDDPTAALRGALLPFGGYKGANIALLVELLAVMAGSNWSVDAPRFDRGSRSPGVGMFVISIDLASVGAELPDRIARHFERLGAEYGADLSAFDGKSDAVVDVVVDDVTYRRLANEAS
ncbi:Ldh family oxidoreductase [Rhodococcus sp. 1R11]|uniref:Ldh family oxidoreductase n=1 Tax=Rhodococcus sp. 1R11 TaxID=2559614 RepID=UPI0014320D83|nr:Ldh family oxidoreductase [Rhodococcus sp. 1R11]